MKIITMIYTGNRPIYNLAKPARIAFPKNVPITINSMLIDHLPSEDFSEYNPKKHKVDNESRPVLIKLPGTYTDILFCVRALYKLREFYPATKIIVLAKDDYRILFPDIERLEMVESYKVKPGQYYKELSCRVYKDSPVFGGAAYKVHTREFSFLQHLKLMYGDDPKKPTLYKVERDPKNLVILNTGTSISAVWKDFGIYLSKQDWKYPVKLINKEEDFKKSFEMLKKARYVISTGDSELNYLAAYLGVPMFIFAKDIKSPFLYQLNFFNNIKSRSVIYSPFVPHKEPEIIHEKLCKIIDDVLNGKPMEEPVPLQEPVETPSGTTGENSGRTRFPISKN